MSKEFRREMNLKATNLSVAEWKEIYLSDRDLALELFYEELTPSQQKTALKWLHDFNYGWLD